MKEEQWIRKKKLEILEINYAVVLIDLRNSKLDRIKDRSSELEDSREEFTLNVAKTDSKHEKQLRNKEDK